MAASGQSLDATRPATTSLRMAWVDVAKGASIVLVVLVHVTTKHLVHLGDVSEGIRADWITFGRWMRPVRMPLFFLLSGLLAASALRSGDRTKLRRRVVRSYELYVVWMLLQTVLVDRYLRPGMVTTHLDGFVHALWLPVSNLWYLWALAAYVGVLALVPRRLRGPLLAGLVLVWLLVSTGRWDLEERERDLLQYAGWFALGALHPAAIRWVVDRCAARRSVVVAVIAGFVLATAELRQFLPTALPALQVVGVLAGLAVAARLRGPVADGLAALGQRTLPIYVLHVPLLVVWAHVLDGQGWEGGAPTPVLLWIYPVVVAAVLIVGSLGIEHALRRVGAGRLFGDHRPLPRPSELRALASATSRRARREIGAHLPAPTPPPSELIPET